MSLACAMTRTTLEKNFHRIWSALVLACGAVCWCSVEGVAGGNGSEDGIWLDGTGRGLEHCQGLTGGNYIIRKEKFGTLCFVEMAVVPLSGSK